MVSAALGAALFLIVSHTDVVCVQRQGCNEQRFTWVSNWDRYAISYRCVYDHSRGMPAHVVWRESVEKTEWGWVVHYSGPCFET